MTFVSGPGRVLLSAGFLAASFCGGALAQGIPTITRLAHEVTIPLANIGVSGNISLPAETLTAIQGGALEIRQSVEYVPLTVNPPGSTGTLRVRHFLVAPGSPNPTPMGAQTNLIENYVANITDVVASSDPNTATFIGTVSGVNTPSPFGQIRGLPFIYSVAYDGTATPARFSNMTLVIPGKVVTFAPTSTGTLTFVPGTEPGTGENRAPVANAGGDFSTAQQEVFLDGSLSTDPDGDPLTYSWRVVQGAANIIDASNVRPRVQFAGNFGMYVFELTVRDDKGATATDTIQITFTGRF